MKNLKKVLSLVLATVMVMSLMIVGAGAVNFTDEEAIEHSEAVQVVSNLNVIGGYPDGTYKPTKTVSRAEMAKMICVALNGGVEPTLGTKDTPTYSDVRNSADAWAEAYIEYCTSLEIVSGVGDGRFSPSATVTGSQAAKMLLVALGYDSAVFGFNGAGWQMAVDANANAAKLYANLPMNVADRGLTRDEAAQMIYNALNANIMEKSYDKILSNGQVSYNYVLSEYKTLLTERFDVYRVEGIVVANEYVTLNDDKASSEGLRAGKTELVVTNRDELRGSGRHPDFLYVTNNVDTTDKAFDLRTAARDTFNVTTGQEEIGMAVVLYVKPSVNSLSTDRASVVGSAIITGNTVLTKDGNWSSDTKMNDALKAAGLKTGTSNVVDYYYVNGVEQSTRYNSGVPENVNGYATHFIDFDGNGTVDVVLVDKVDFGMVSAYTTSGDGSITLSTGAAAISYKDSADVVGFNDVTKNTYVLYSEVGGKLYVEKAPSVTGVLTDFSNQTLGTGSNRGGAKSLWVDGTKYTNSGVNGRTVNNLSDPVNYQALDKTGTFYFDACGYVVSVDGTGVKQYTLITYRNTGAYDSGFITESDRVQAFYEDGTSGTPVVSHTDADYTGTWSASNAKTELDKLFNDTMGVAPAQANKAMNAFLGAYEFNGDDRLVLTPATETKTQADGILKYTSGNVLVTVGGVNLKDASGYNYYMTDKTVLFVATTADTTDPITANKVDKVNVYNGKDSFPSFELTKDYKLQYVVNSDNEIEAVAIITSDMQTVGNNFLYVISVTSSATNTKQVKVVLNNEIQTITVNSKKGNTLTKGLNEYAIEADGNYKLTRIPSNVVAEQAVERKNENLRTIVVNGTEYKITNDTNFANIDDEVVSSFEELNRGDIVTVLASKNGDMWEAKGVYVLNVVDSEAPTKVEARNFGTKLNTSSDGLYQWIKLSGADDEVKTTLDQYGIKFGTSDGNTDTYRLTIRNNANEIILTDTKVPSSSKVNAWFTVDVTGANGADVSLNAAPNGTYYYTVTKLDGGINPVVLSGFFVK